MGRLPPCTGRRPLPTAVSMQADTAAALPLVAQPAMPAKSSQLATLLAALACAPRSARSGSVAQSSRRHVLAAWRWRARSAAARRSSCAAERARRLVEQLLAGERGGRHRRGQRRRRRAVGGVERLRRERLAEADRAGGEVAHVEERERARRAPGRRCRGRGWPASGCAPAQARSLTPPRRVAQLRPPSAARRASRVAASQETAAASLVVAARPLLGARFGTSPELLPRASGTSPPAASVSTVSRAIATGSDLPCSSHRSKRMLPAALVVFSSRRNSTYSRDAVW